MAETFAGSFTQQAPLPQEAFDAAMAVLGGARLHRYNLAGDERGEVAALEAEYAAWQGRAHCVAVASGGQAMQIALRACGIGSGDAVLTNAFTLSPVPGAIAALGARTRLVEIGEDLRIDLADLRAKSPGARALLLSLMRGHLPDMEALAAICDAAGLILIEDCAHTMGATWNGTRSGNFGHVACFSTQTYKHLNSGEGGLLCTDDPGIAARATVLSGSYMLFGRHGAGPEPDAFEAACLDMPNLSARMDALRAAILRPQLPRLKDNIARWAALYGAVAQGLRDAPGLVLPPAPPAERRVGSSIQFRVPDFSDSACEAFVAGCSARGVELKWFGRARPLGFTSAHRSWRFAGAHALPRTDAILATLFDMRLPLTFTPEDGTCIARIIRDVLGRTRAGRAA